MKQYSKILVLSNVDMFSDGDRDSLQEVNNNVGIGLKAVRDYDQPGSITNEFISQSEELEETVSEMLETPAWTEKLPNSGADAAATRKTRTRKRKRQENKVGLMESICLTHSS